LNLGIKSIPVLVEQFPNLEVVVLSIYFHCIRPATDKRKQHFRTDVLEMRNFRQAGAELGWGDVTIEATVLELVATLARLRPGVRVLIRFGHVFAGYSRHVGPLVQVRNVLAHDPGQAIVSDVEDETGPADDPAITIARKVFAQAYYAPRVARSGHIFIHI
jgi:hypothetical protein